MLNSGILDHPVGVLSDPEPLGFTRFAIKRRQLS